MSIHAADFCELYNEFLVTIREKPQRPYTMHNEELAREYYAELKKEDPNAFILCVDGFGQFITITDKARNAVAKTLEEQARKTAERARQLERYAEEVRRKDGTTCNL